MTAVGKFVAAEAVCGFAWVITGVRANWVGCVPEAKRRVYFANHNSHGDFVLIWSVLPRDLRARTRPVAGADYWLKDKARRFIGADVFRAVLIERDPEKRDRDPIAQMAEALDDGASLILFPEGTRNTTETRLLPFKSGLYHLASTRPDVEFVPVWIENLNRVLPKGELVPVPLLCTVTFGTPIMIEPEEPKDAFLHRARDGLLAIAPRDAAPTPPVLT